MKDQQNSGMLKFSCIVSSGYRFVYLVTPKVACSSIKWALLPLLQEADLSQQEMDTLPRFQHIHRFLRRRGLHITSQQYERRRRSGRFGGYFCFSFIRNPWDRLVSCYTSKVAGVGAEPVRMRLGGKANVFRRGMPFAEFLRIVCDTPDERSNAHLASQVSILRGTDGVLLPDFIGRFENLAADFHSVVERVAPGRRIQLDVRNSSRERRRDYRSYFTDSEAELIGRRYAGDVHAFGYCFDRSGFGT